MDLHENPPLNCERDWRTLGQFDMTLIHKDYSRTPTGAVELGKDRSEVEAAVGNCLLSGKTKIEMESAPWMRCISYT